MLDIEHGHPTSSCQIDIDYGATLRTQTPTTQTPRTIPRGYPTIEGDTRYCRDDRDKDVDKDKDRDRDRESDRTRDRCSGRCRYTEHVTRDRM